MTVQAQKAITVEEMEDILVSLHPLAKALLDLPIFLLVFIFFAQQHQQ